MKNTFLRDSLFIIDPGCKISMLSKGNNKDTPYFINAEEFERIKEKWSCANLNIPHLIFWNIIREGKAQLLLNIVTTLPMHLDILMRCLYLYLMMKVIQLKIY